MLCAHEDGVGDVGKLIVNAYLQLPRRQQERIVCSGEVASVAHWMPRNTNPNANLAPPAARVRPRFPREIITNPSTTINLGDFERHHLDGETAQQLDPVHADPRWYLLNNWGEG